MDSVLYRIEAQTVLALHRSNGILHMLLEDYASSINFHERKNIYNLIEKIEEQVIYENEEGWLTKCLEVTEQVRQVFRIFEQLSAKMGLEELRICMILSEAELKELEFKISQVLHFRKKQ